MKLSMRGACWLPVRGIREGQMKVGKRTDGAGIRRDVHRNFPWVPHAGGLHGSAIFFHPGPDWAW